MFTINAMKQEVVVSRAYNAQSFPNFTFDKSLDLKKLVILVAIAGNRACRKN